MESSSRASAWLAIAGIWALGFLAAVLLADLRPWRRTEIFVAAAVLALALSVIAWRNTQWLDSYCDRPLRWLHVAWRPVVAVALIASSAYFIVVMYAGYQDSKARNLAVIPHSLSSGVTVAELRTRQTYDIERYPSLSLGPPAPASGIIDRANELLGGHIALASQRPVPFSARTGWNDDPFGRRWAFLLHAMLWLDDLLIAYRNSGDLAYLARAEALVLSWIDTNSTYLFRPPSEFSWNDHSAAIRATVWVRFWETWRFSPLWDESKATRFLSSLFAHATQLADPRFYSRRHNHGIDQDIALIAIAAAFQEHKNSREWTALATHRVKEQIEDIVSADGVQREHSPAYHIRTLNNLSELQRFGALVGIPLQVHGASLAELLEKMVEVASHFVLPSRQLTPIGDTSRTEAITEHTETLRRFTGGLSDGARFVFSGGAVGKAPADLAWFKNEGYAVVRRWKTNTFSDGLYLLFVGASNKDLGHKHQDDLSFILHSCGRALVDDAGNVSYQSDDQRAFVVGPYGHSSVVIGEPELTPWRGGTGRARITGAIRHAGFTELSGVTDEHARYRHRRTLLLLDRGVLVVLDRLTEKPAEAKVARALPVKFTQLFNIGPGLAIDSSAQDTLSARESTEPILQVQVLTPGDASRSVLMGQKSPMIGWRAPKFGAPLEPVPAIAIGTKGTSATIATVLRFHVDCQGPLDHSEVSMTSDAQGSTFVEWVGARGARLSYNWR